MINEDGLECTADGNKMTCVYRGPCKGARIDRIIHGLNDLEIKTPVRLEGRPIRLTISMVLEEE